MRIGKIVEDSDLVSGFQKLQRGVRADVAGPTGNKNGVFLGHVGCVGDLRSLGVRFFVGPGQSHRQWR